MNWYNVGKIVNTHGITGEVRVISSTDFPDERYTVGNKLSLFMPGEKTPIHLTVASHRKHKTFDLLTFENHPFLQDVEKYRDGIFRIAEEDLGELEEGVYYHHEIIGCVVSTVDGAEIGTITEILVTGANDVWTVVPEKGKAQYIPFIDDVVKDIDIENKKIVIDPMEGLLT